MAQQGDHRKRHLTRATLFAQVLGRPAHHLPCDEHSYYQEQQKVDHADALATVYAVHPHPPHWRERYNRVQAVMLAVDRAAGHVHGHSREGGASRSTETHFLALEIAEM